MTATLTHPDPALDELATDTIPPLLGKGRREAFDEPQHPRSERMASAVAPSSDDSGSWQRQALPRHPTPSFNPKSQDPIPLPLLNRLLTLYTTHANSFNDFCRELDLSMLELLDLLEHPDVTRALERLAHASETRAKLLARLTNDSAVSALIDLMDTTDKPETRRKAAGAILRHGKPPAKSAKREIRDALPLPLGEGRGEGHQLRPDPSPRATDPDAASAVESVRSYQTTSEPPPPRGEGRGEGLDPRTVPALGDAIDGPSAPSRASISPPSTITRAPPLAA